MANRIHAKGPYVYEEYKANSALIYPGYLVKVDSNGEVAPHAAAGGFAEAIFAMEDVLQGRDDSTIYADNSIVACIIPHKGSVIRAMIKAGETIEIGEFLKSNGDGTLVSAGAEVGSGQETYEHVLAVAVEANDLSAGGAVDTISMVRIV
jgi:hypothetical protein